MNKFVLALSLAFFTSLAGVSFSADLTPEEEKGKIIYDKLCVGCHGEKGKGDGAAADRLNPKPRNFRLARYKYTYTMFGKLPQKDTIYKWIAEGLPGTSMPGWKDILSEKDINNLVAYITSKAVTKKFARAKKKGRIAKPIEINPPKEFSEADIKEGQELFNKACEKCHGFSGRGSGPSAPALKHDLGYRIWPRNLTKGWTFRGGNQVEDIYRTAATGISGTPMPAHLESMKVDEIWKIAAFVDSIAEWEEPKIKEVIVSKLVEGDVAKDPEDERWNEIEAGYIPLVSQIIEGERWFTTTLESVEVSSMYNETQIAILVKWDDHTQSPLTTPPANYPENEPDALAIQLPTEISTGMEKPYFLGGAEDKPVVLWNWTNGKETKALLGKGILKTEEMDAGSQTVQSSALYVDGQWKAVFVRPLAAPEGDLTIEVGKYIPLAFSVWDGNNNEKNEQRAVSIWYWLLLDPPRTLMVYFWPAIIGLLIVACEVWLVFKAKRNEKTD